MTQATTFKAAPTLVDIAAIEREARRMRSEAIREGAAALGAFLRRRFARPGSKVQAA